MYYYKRHVNKIFTARRVCGRKQVGPRRTYSSIQRRLNQLRSDLFLASLKSRSCGIKWKILSGIIGGLDFMGVQLETVK